MINSPSEFRIEPLGNHDRAAFSCGRETLDIYLREQASQDARKLAAAPFVLLTVDNRIAGYYTLSSSMIRADDLPPETIKKWRWPRYPELPAVLIGRLARDVSFKGQGVGELLLMDALKRSLKSCSNIASVAVIADAKDDNGRQFYERYGFIMFLDARNRLYLPMKTIQSLPFNQIAEL